MESISMGVSTLKGSRLAYGCWRIAGNPVTAESIAVGKRAILAAFEAGYTVFDNADIYGRGEAEKILGAVLKENPGIRERVLITTKCGVQHAGNPTPDSPHRWNFSSDYIVNSCEQSLRRLNLDMVDIFMLHRPDFLADPAEIADAFTLLRESGKVQFFGVSNFRPTLLTAVQAVCPMPLIAHEVEISLARLESFTDGTLDQCLIEKITPIAWSPLAGGLIGQGAGRLLPAQRNYRPEQFLPAVDAIAKERGVTRAVVALAWLLKHPSRIVPIVGSVNPQRIAEAVKSTELKVTREEWYRLLTAARGEPLP